MNDEPMVEFFKEANKAGNDGLKPIFVMHRTPSNPHYPHMNMLTVKQNHIAKGVETALTFASSDILKRSLSAVKKDAMDLVERTQQLINSIELEEEVRNLYGEN